MDSCKERGPQALRGHLHGAWVRGIGSAAILLTAAAGPVRAQEHVGQYAQADIQYGSAIYAAQCAQCHGVTGDQIGGVDLRAGRLRRAATDDLLRGILQGGIPGTGMPSFRFDPSEMSGIIAFVRNMRDFDPKSVPVGNAAMGRELFQGKGACSACHRVNGNGSRIGPNLSEIGSMRPASALHQSLIDPTSQMLPINRSVRAITKDGKTVTGRRLNEDTYTLLLIDQQEHLMALSKGDLREFTVIKTSPMPSYKDRFTPEELSHVVAYLLSLKTPRS